MPSLLLQQAMVRAQGALAEGSRAYDLRTWEVTGPPEGPKEDVWRVVGLGQALRCGKSWREGKGKEREKGGRWGGMECTAGT